MHDEVFEAAQDAGSLSRDAPGSAGSSPSEAYANMTLESRETTDSMTAQSDQAPPKQPPRSSSPAKRPHSDMDDHTHADASSARRGSGQSSPRPTKPLPTASQRSGRATSVEMADAPANGASTASSETASVSNTESAVTSMSTQSTPPHRAANVPSLDEQVAKVLAIHNQQLNDGQEGYVISERWLARVFARTSENKNNPEQFDKAAVEGDIGPVDNSDLIDADALADEDLSDQNGEDFVPLRPGLTMGQDFEILPAEAWELIISWYGLKESTPVIRRYVHNTAFEGSENLQYEVYPCIFTIRKVRKTTSSGVPKRGPKLIASRSDSYVEFLRAAKKAASIPLKTKVRVWRVLSTAPTDQAAAQPSGILTPESSPQPGSPIRNQTFPLIIEEGAFTALAESTERELVTGKDETANEKYNGHLNLQIAGLAEDQVLILEEQDDRGEYLTESTRKNGSLVKIAGKADKGLQSATNSGRSSPASSGIMTRGRTRTGRTRGTVGLTNLGNTCYMNSALQCIRSVEELSIYFLDQKYKLDLNADNPLGHGGSIAKNYANLLDSIYNVEGTSSFSPKAFKMALGRAQPLFSGYGQQDSQEFLSFLVDGLHEDLNRIKKKPYIENPESDDNTVHDPEAIKALGEKFRDIHRSRNDSVAMDLFNGFYKNTMVCPDCDKVSITFDPYSLLTLQLPIEQTWQHTVTFVPLRGRPVNVEIDIDKNATIKGVKEYVAQRFLGVKWNRLMGAEVYSHKFYRVLDDHKSIAESNIGQRDVIFFYELEAVPTNWPPKKKKKTQYRSVLYPSMSSEEDIPKSASPLGDRMLVPIFHRKPGSSSYRGPTMSLALTPSYIILTREEAKDELTIWKKVLAKVAQMTTRPILTELSDTPLHDQSRSGSDVVLTTEEDAAPNGDPRVHDGSVEGEDMVEVTMTEPADTNVEQPSEDDVPEVLKPGTFIPPAFRTLFEIRHTKPGKEMVPTGWSSIDANKPFELIAKRIRASASRQSSVHSLEGNSPTSSSDADDDDTPQFSADPQSSIDVANQSSEEEMQSMPSIESEPFSRGGRANSKKNKRKNNKKNQKRGQMTYSKKGKDRFSRQTSQVQSDPESDDEEGLLRLGEALVLDWTAEAYEALFDGVLDGNDERGADVLNDVETLEDPELQVKKTRRAARKKNGITLEECFAETSKSEILSEDNAWYCSRCKELRRATKTLEIWTVPDILVIHLKRFSAHRTFRDKIEALVDCPLEGLDLAGKVGLPEDKGLVYDLFAVDNHYGGLGGGHYTASARNFFDGKWYDYNDSHVSSRSADKVVTPSAYLLFYRRRSDVPLGPPFLQEIVDRFHNPGSNDAADDDDSDAPKSRNASRSPAGNGSRLDGLSRNGSSSAFGAAAGALRGGGSALAGSLQLKGAAAGTADADDQEMLLGGQQENLPAYDEDEGYADDDDDRNFSPVNVENVYDPLYRQMGGASRYGIGNNTPDWNFDQLGGNQDTLDDYDNEAFDEDAASDAPNLGSRAGNDLDERMLEDFGDELTGGVQGLNPGLGTPLEEEVPPLLGGEMGDGEVADVVLDDEVGVEGPMTGRVKLD